MPIYEYECAHCGLFEEMQRISDQPLKTCAKCNSPIRRVLSASTFALKGGGWYKDLYSSTPSTSSSSSDSGSSSAA